MSELSGGRLRPKPPSALCFLFSPHPGQAAPPLPSDGRCALGAAAHPETPRVATRRQDRPRPLSRLVPWSRAGGGAEGEGMAGISVRYRGVEEDPGLRQGGTRNAQGLSPPASCFPPPRAGGVDVTLTDGRKREKVILNDFEGLQVEKTRVSPDDS